MKPPYEAPVYWRVNDCPSERLFTPLVTLLLTEATPEDVVGFVLKELISKSGLKAKGHGASKSSYISTNHGL